MTVVQVEDAPIALERTYGVIAHALSGGRRQRARLSFGTERTFSLSSSREVVRVPYPILELGWTMSTITGGIGLQCSPSKERLAGLQLGKFSSREQRALSLVEGSVAFAWIEPRWPVLSKELRRWAPTLLQLDPDLDGPEIVDRALALAKSRRNLPELPILGSLGPGTRGHHFLSRGRRLYGRMPWSTVRRDKYRLWSVPYGGDGGVQSPTLPAPSRPEDEDAEMLLDQRIGVPYPEWNAWTSRFLKDHVSVIEIAHGRSSHRSPPPEPEISRWFQRHTYRLIHSGLEEGSEIDVDRYVAYAVDCASGGSREPRIFRDLLPGARDVTTALLLDGSASVGSSRGEIFRIELACADALSRSMSLAQESHGIFVFSGNTRHRVEVRCLKDFDDRHFVAPGESGLVAGGYTRLGAPIRHLTARLLERPSQHRLLIVIGDGLISDEGYEGRYAWADVGHALEEADDANVVVFYIGIGTPQVDPLPEVFGPRRSSRLHSIGELPRVLSLVHDRLVAA